MMATEFEKVSGILSEFADKFVVSRTAVYNWVNRYKDELLSEGIITEKKRGGRKYIYIKDIHDFIDFFKERGVYLTDDYD